MVVTIEADRVDKVRGNRDHPFTRGGLCVKVTDYPRHIYAAERVTTPLRRADPKGSGQFRPIRWDAALDRIAAQFSDDHRYEGAEAILPYSYLGNMGVLNGLTVGDRFFNGLGTSVSERTFCDGGAITAYLMTLGPDGGRRPRVVGALEVHHDLGLQRAVQQPALVAVHRRGPGEGGQGGVHRPGAASHGEKADWHLPIRPGSDAALALAMMHVILGEGLQDNDYLEEHTVGADGSPPTYASTARSGPKPRPASRPRTSAPWPGSTPPPSRR